MLIAVRNLVPDRAAISDGVGGVAAAVRVGHPHVLGHSMSPTGAPRGGWSPWWRGPHLTVPPPRWRRREAPRSAAQQTTPIPGQSAEVSPLADRLGKGATLTSSLQAHGHALLPCPAGGADYDSAGREM